jgi:hypothetical protein
VLNDIERCRTAALGGHVDHCLACGYEHPAYNSCRSRYCPKCQALAQERWIDAQRGRVLNVPHFHVVFALPAELRPLARFAPRAVYGALLHAVGRTLLEFGERRLDATIGATLVLHTWRRDLEFHPHVHALVTAGGLSRDRSRGCHARRTFLFPVKPMGTVFFGKMTHVLTLAYREGRFRGFHDFRDPEGFARLLRSVAHHSWYVYAKPTLSHGEPVIEYLGRSTHRAGMSNSRLLDVTRYCIRFRTRGHAIAALPPVEFLRRLLLHILPSGFHRIRHLGLNASPTARERARACLALPAPVLPLRSWQQCLADLTGRDVSRCPRCGGPLIALPLPNARDPPELSVA